MNFLEKRPLTILAAGLACVAALAATRAQAELATESRSSIEAPARVASAR